MRPGQLRGSGTGQRKIIERARRLVNQRSGGFLLTKLLVTHNADNCSGYGYYRDNKFLHLSTPAAAFAAL